jgi:hypothetical protein
MLAWSIYALRLINTLAPILMNQGDLVLKRIGTKRYYDLRFLLPEDQRGQRRHCSLYVGREGRESDQGLVARIRDLLEHIREPRRQIEEIARYVQITKIMRYALQSAARELNTSTE